MNTKTLRRRIERRHMVHFWGRRYFITPRLVERQLGDGAQLLWFQPLNTRPDYYVIRIDAAWDSRWDVCEHYEEIIEAIEESFGNAEWARENNPRVKNKEQFPALDDDTGAAWGVYTLPAERKVA